MTSRSYRSPQREAAAQETRERILAAAGELLAGAEGVARFSLDSVGKAAGVTRLTVYNQFGSRAALLEAVFDRVAHDAGIARLAQAMGEPDPHEGLRKLVVVFCNFWSHDREMMARLHTVGAADDEFRNAVVARSERRRHVLAALVKRMGGTPPAAATVRDLVDVLFALTGFAFFAELTAGGRSAEKACALIQEMAADAVRRAGVDPAP